MSEELGYKVCPDCLEEYTLVMQQCAHCDVALVSPHEIPSDDDGDAEDFPPASELVYLRVAPLPWIRALSDGLEGAGVPHRVEPGSVGNPPEGQRPETFGAVDLFGLYVLQEDEETARGLDSQIAAIVAPEQGEEAGAGEADACPACGADLSLEASSCPNCGLGLS
jgi:hypothetical protein